MIYSAGPCLRERGRVVSGGGRTGVRARVCVWWGEGSQSSWSFPQAGSYGRQVAPLEARLEAAGVPYTRSKSGRAAIFFRDPDQNTLECVETEAWR